MVQTDYLILGSSHAALSAVHALRMHDSGGSVTIATRDGALPYSPTVLPYVVSGRSRPEGVFLRDAAYFERSGVDYRTHSIATGVNTERNIVRFAGGEDIGYQKLLIATGARAVVPAIPGLSDTPFHVLRTLDDALRLKEALNGARRAIVMGGGLVGMHAAENLAKAGVAVTIVELQPHVLAGYFDPTAAALIEQVFGARGVAVMTGRKVVGVQRRDDGCLVELDDGKTIEADLLLVGVGVTPVADFLRDSRVEVDRGILVDDTMRTSAANIWAAGDVVQARNFYTGTPALNGILPNAVEQGRIAGMAMAGDPGLKPYPGGIPLNTYTFFGNQAVSVGIAGSGDGAEETLTEVDAERRRYLKIVLKDNRLLGIFGINAAFDPGVMWELVLRRTDLGPVKGNFLVRPQETARALMSRVWR